MGRLMSREQFEAESYPTDTIPGRDGWTRYLDSLIAGFTVMCDGCSERTDEPTDCEHGRTLCPDCVAGFAPCHHCVREARDA